MSSGKKLYRISINVEAAFYGTLEEAREDVCEVLSDELSNMWISMDSDIVEDKNGPLGWTDDDLVYHAGDADITLGQVKTWCKGQSK